MLNFFTATIYVLSPNCAIKNKKNFYFLFSSIIFSIQRNIIVDHSEWDKLLLHLEQRKS
jgi:hypothetical protein